MEPSIAERGLNAVMNQVVTGLRRMDAIVPDESGEITAFQKFCPQINKPAAKGAAEL